MPCNWDRTARLNDILGFVTSLLSVALLRELLHHVCIKSPLKSHNPDTNRESWDLLSQRHVCRFSFFHEDGPGAQ